jgi:type IV secretion system protein VirB4
MRKTAPLAHFRQSKPFHAFVPISAFVNDSAFVTKHGEYGCALRLHGIDDECLTDERLEAVVSTLTGAFSLFGERFRLYQYLIKSRKKSIVRQETYADPKLAEVIQDRIEFLENHAPLGSVQLYLVILFECETTGQKHRTSVDRLRKERTHALATLSSTVQSFKRYVDDLVMPEVLPKRECFWLLRKLLNLTDGAASRLPLKRNVGVDWQTVASRLDWERDGRLTLNDRQLKLLSLKELPSATGPHLFRDLLAIDCDLIACTEWIRRENPQVRRAVKLKKAHFFSFNLQSFGSIVSQAVNRKENKPDPLLEDESGRWLVQSLNEALLRIEEHGGYFGMFSMTLLLHSEDAQRLEIAKADVFRTLSTYEAEALEETYGALNAYLAMLPGNTRYNVRQLWLQNNHYADLSFFFAPYTGSTRAVSLEHEYLAVFEGVQGEAMYFDPHHAGVWGQLVLGVTGSGKSMLGNVLVTNAQKYDGYTFIFDIRGSYHANAQRFGATILSMHLDQRSFSINPFCLPNSPDNRQFLFNFIKLLLKQSGREFAAEDDKDLHRSIQAVYILPPDQRRLSNLYLRPDLQPYLDKWIRKGQYAAFFDNAADTLTLHRFQVFDFAGMEAYEEVLEPLLVWVIGRINAVIYDPANAGVLKYLVFDELWKHLKNPALLEGLIGALKTGRKDLVGWTLLTQSAGDLGEYTEIIKDTCPMTMFLPNPDFDRAAYADLFHLNAKELELLAHLRARHFLLKTPSYSKVLVNNIDPKTYWMYTTAALERKRRDEAVSQYGEAAFEALAAENA